MSAGTQLQTKEQNRPHPLLVIKGQIEERESEFARALPAHIPVERFKRVVLTAVQNNPDLLAADRQSFFNACMRSAQDGLLPDGRDGAIVIYNTKDKDRWVKKAQWMPMVFGILKKIRNSGELASITARVVYGGDKFRYWIDDSGEHVEYEPADTPDTNVIRRVFAMARTKSGELYVEPMSVDEIEKVRAVSRSKDKGPWADWWDQMAIKTVLRRLAKRLPMSSDLDDLIRRDDDLYDLRGASDTEVKGPRLSMTAALDRLAAPSTSQPSSLMIEGTPSDGTDQEQGPEGQDDVEEDQPTRGHTAEHAEAGRIVDERGNVVKDKNPEAPGTSGVAGEAAEGKGSGVPSAAADDFPGDKPMKQAPDFDALLAEFEQDAPNATTEEELGELAADLRAAMDENPPTRAFQTKAANVWQDHIDRIKGLGSKNAGNTAGGADQNDPDFKRGWSDAEKGVKRCLKSEIRDNPDRLAKWQAGFDAFHSQQAEG
jgi:recombination protein RecT